MHYITSERLQAFMKKYVDEDGEVLVNSYCKAGMEEVKKYLGYDPELSEITYHKRGTNSFLFALPAKPIAEITAFKIDGVEKDVSLLEITDSEQNYLQFSDGYSAFTADHDYSLTFKAGWKYEEVTEGETTTVTNEVPYLIQLTALQLASLFWESAGGNLAVSSTSFADTGSRVFNNFTADRFLKQIEAYRINL